MKEVDVVLEKKLENILRPVAPREDYIEEFRYRLSQRTGIGIEYPDYGTGLVVVGIGLTAGLLALFILKRIFRLFR